MTAEQSNPILNSELAYDILELLAKKEKGDYGKRIAEELGKPQSSVCRVLTSLTEEGFVKKGERTRAQYYKINYDGITEFWHQSLEQEIDEDSEEHQLLDENTEKVKEFGKSFFNAVMNDCSENSITVSELLYNSIICSIGEKLSEQENFVQKNSFMRPITEGTLRRLEMHGHPDEMERIVEEIQSN